MPVEPHTHAWNSCCLSSIGCMSFMFNMTRRTNTSYSRLYFFRFFLSLTLSLALCLFCFSVFVFRLLHLRQSNTALRYAHPHAAFWCLVSFLLPRMLASRLNPSCATDHFLSINAHQNKPTLFFPSRQDEVQARARHPGDRNTGEMRAAGLS